MRTGSTLQPGRRGTKKLLAHYGAALLCVRYRYDSERRRRLKTVELIVAEAPWSPPPPRLVEVGITYGETELRARVKSAGGTWDPNRRTWKLPYAVAPQLGLKQRIVQ